MNNLTEFTEACWVFLNHPFIVIGKTSITLWLIFFNIFVVFSFLFLSSKLKNWILTVLVNRQGFNMIRNWRTPITLSYYAFLVIGLVGILQSTGLDLSIFTVLTGAIGIGVGFGMQAIFSNFISGIIILLEKPLKLGDRIEVGEVSGNVQSISARATTIVTNDNVSVIIPNSDFISKQVINWSYSGNTVRLSVPVSVAYQSEPEQVAKLLIAVADREPGVLKKPVPVVHLAEFGESGLRFNLLIWTEEYCDRKGALKSLINFGILKTFRENNIHMPFPQRDIHVHTVSAAAKETP